MEWSAEASSVTGSKTKFVCERCGKVFDTEEELFDHEITHVNEDTAPAGVY